MKIKTIIIGLLVALAMASCSTEINLANRFVTQAPSVRAAVYFPEEAKVTLVQDEHGNYTKVLDSLDQDAFLDIMYSAYATQLRTYGIDVYIPEDQENVEVDSIHWLVVLTQMEIQGRITPYTDEYYDFIDTYEYQVPLNTVNVASWFDINDGDWHPTLFYEHNLMDDFDSHVVRKDGGYSYEYSVIAIKSEDIYNYAVFLGKLYADYTFTEMMNKYVHSEMAKTNAKPRFKMRWDPEEKMFYFVEDEDGFIELD